MTILKKLFKKIKHEVIYWRLMRMVRKNETSWELMYEKTKEDVLKAAEGKK